MTSLNNYIKFTLNIEADNLEFLDTPLGKYRGREAKFYHAVLHLDHCLVCCSNHIWHNGHSYSNVRYLALDASLPVFIRIAKERIICQDCHHNSMAETNLVNKYCHISNPVKRKIISALTEDMSMKTIAIQNSVSTCTVQRMLEKYQTTSTQDYDWHLKDTLTQEQIVTDGLALSEELENTYNLLQDISKALINKNVSDLRKLLNCKDTIGYQMAALKVLTAK